jgi:DNA adenine methylase
MLSELLKQVPSKYNSYIEPFIGGGALFFSLNPKNAILSDSNSELIITYIKVRDQVEDIISILKEYKNEEKFYYHLRSIDPFSLSDVERAARFIFLNKTCYNGLYRVNKKGQFNVPYGKSSNAFLNNENLRNASLVLQNKIIMHGDYLEVLQLYAKNGDFIFLDPPYYPIAKYSDFKRYTKEFFYHEDHIKLKDEFDRLVNLGCTVILTNSDHPFILELFGQYKIEIFETKRMINSDSKSRIGRDIIVTGK